MVNNLVLDNTPIDEYKLNGKHVWVKREDLSCPFPAPSFSKIRGVAARIKELPKGTLVGVLDTFHSKAGWGVAYICQKLGYDCVVFFPKYNSDKRLRYQQEMAIELGAKLVPLKAGRSSILYHQAKRILLSLSNQSYMMPNALKLTESVDETALETMRTLTQNPHLLRDTTWIISASSGTIAAGVIRGLNSAKRLNGGELSPRVIIHMGYTRSKSAIGRYIRRSSGYKDAAFELVDEGYQYKDKVECACPFPSNPYYDLKAWKWLKENTRETETPNIMFWNIGA